MISELIIVYALISNEPLYFGKPSWTERAANIEARLEVRQPLTERIFLRLSPYVIGDSFDTMGRAGAEAEIGYDGDRFVVSVFHQSEHNLDRDGQALEVDGVKFRWKMR